MATVVERPRPLPVAAPPPRKSWPWRPLAEAAAVVLSPVVAFFVLQLRAMAPSDIPDTGIQLMYVVDPRDVFMRFSQAYASTSRLREGARVGYNVPARVSYLLFGGVGGFYVFRYVLVLLAAGSAYLLLRRCYGRLAGVAGIAAILASPVLVTAWGTDYPDSAGVSYLVAGVACLAMPSAPRRRRSWMAAGAFFLVMATWAHGTGGLLAAAAVAAYLAVRLLRERTGLAVDVGILAGVAVATTGALMVGSGLLEGQFDFVVPTIRSLAFLSEPAQRALWHSASPRWAPYVSYLLVLPATAAAFLVTFVSRRGRRPPIGTPQLVVGLAFGVQLLVSIYMQFFGNLETLEQHYFSSMLWGGALLAFAVTLVELAQRAGGRYVQLLPTAAIVLVALGYVLLKPGVPTFGWAPYGFVLAGLLVASVALARAAGALRRPTDAWIAASAGFIGAALCAFVLTVAHEPSHALIPNTSRFDPVPAYSSALGGDATSFLDQYRVATELPGFVGNATYPDEQLLMWTTWATTGNELQVLGLYRGGYNLLPSSPPAITGADRAFLDQRRPAELLLIGPIGAWFDGAVAALAGAGYQPAVVRSTTLRSGSYVVHAELLTLHAYPPVAPGAAP